MRPAILAAALAPVVFAALLVAAEPAKEKPKLAVGDQAPAFTFKDASGKTVDLAELTAKGPVLVRLTCGCLGCDKELPYFQAIHTAYGKQGLVSVAVFREPDEKVAKYVADKKLDMLYAVDPKGGAWEVFGTKTMPTNFLIEKGGKIVSIDAGCDPSGLLAKRLSAKVAKTVEAEPVDVKKAVDEKK
jgi:peroxiredoxin